jgi:pimeloyl-ACP methyl ester carboxylesterase
VKKLVLCSTWCGGSKKVLPSKELIEKWINPGELNSEEIINQLIIECFTENFIKNNTEFIKLYKQRMLKNPISLDILQRQQNAGGRFNALRRLKEIHAPTLILHGKDDFLIPPENAEILGVKILNSEVILLDNAAHIFFQPDPKRAIGLINEFLLK